MTASSENHAITVSEAGEKHVLSVILRTLEATAVENVITHVVVAPGDDAAVMRLDGDAVISSDAMVEGADFSLAWSTGFQLGWKLAATNLSDVASMGASPSGLTVTVLAPDDTPVQLLVDVARGLSAACAELAPGCEVVGGDLSSSSQLAFAVTAVGSMGGRTPVTRGGARPGDLVAYAGSLGLSGAGLRLLSAEAGEAQSIDDIASLWEEYPEALAAHLTPSPPIELGPAAADAGVTAMMDVSDSLSLDAARLGAASQVTLNLRSDSLQAFSSTSSLNDVLTGGEDHGLLATFPAGCSLPAGFVEIGMVEPQSVDLLVDGELFLPRGWDPFQRESLA